MYDILMEKLRWLEIALVNQDEAILAGLIIAAITFFSGFLTLHIREKFSKTSKLPVDPDRSMRKNKAGDLRSETEKNRYNSIPPQSDCFEGRDVELEEISAFFDSAQKTNVFLINGMGGIGKTEISIQIAKKLTKKGRLVNGVLMIDLQGFAEAGSPLSARQALLDLMGQINESISSAPEGVDDGQYSKILSNEWRRATKNLDILVILDNAYSKEQVELLIPNHNVPVIITSRNKISISGAGELQLGRLDDAGAEELIRKLCPNLEVFEVQRFREIADGLPLLIDVASPVINDRDGRSTSQKIDAFAAAGGEDEELIKLRRRLQLSLSSLDAENLEKYLAMSVFEFGAYSKSLSVLWDESIDKAEQRLSHFKRRSLVILQSENRNGVFGSRWRLHDYMRSAAFEMIMMMDIYDHFKFRREYSIFELANQLGKIFETSEGDLQEASRVLDTEIPNIVQCIERLSFEMESDEVLANFVMLMGSKNFLNFRVSHGEKIEILKRVSRAGEILKLEIVSVVAESNIANVYVRQSKFEDAIPIYEKVIDKYTQLDYPEGKAALMSAYGAALYHIKDLEKAKEILTEALDLNKKFDQLNHMVTAKINLGKIEEDLGNIATARAMYEDARCIAVEMSTPFALADVYDEMARFFNRTKDSASCVVYYRKAYEEHIKTGHVYKILGTSVNYILALLESRELERIPGIAETGLRLSREIGSDYHEMLIYNNYALYNLALGDLSSARESIHKGEEIARRRGDEENIAKFNELFEMSGLIRRV